MTIEEKYRAVSRFVKGLRRSYVVIRWDKELALIEWPTLRRIW